MERTLQMQVFITKWLSGDTATGRIMCRRKSRNASFCPRCGATDEHLLHVITCPCREASKLRSTTMTNLQQWFDTRQTHPAISRFFIMGFNKWVNNKDHVWRTNSAIFSDCPTINRALNSQLRVSWYYMICGMITKDLINLQQIHYHQLSSLRSANRWATDLIKFFWNFLHSLWLQRNEALHKEASIYKNSRRVI